MSDVTATQGASFGIRWGLAAAAVLLVVGLAFAAVRIVLAPANSAAGVTERLIAPEHVLASYRWFHEARAQIEVKQAQIRLAREAAAAAPEDRRSAREVELLGLQQSCQSLVGQYNARAGRADTRVFLDPGLFDDAGPPLPERIELSVCE